MTSGWSVERYAWKDCRRRSCGKRHERLAERREGGTDRPAACNLPKAEEETKEISSQATDCDPALLLHGSFPQAAKDFSFLIYLARAALSGAKSQKSSTFRLSPLS